mmetsp:Transcript_6232/g.8811  ORF Transcript_6232/g.8811 Transcript_6232/m.8811 type:complete len:1455 (+) Transcript_6232:93-4457(+)
MSEVPSGRAQGVTDSLAHLTTQDEATESELESAGSESESESDSETEEEDSNHRAPGSKVLSIETASASSSPVALKSSENNNGKSKASSKKTKTPKNGGKKVVQTPKSKKTTASPKTPGTSGGASTSTATSRGGAKTYLVMVHESIVALKDRSGSSQIAISKYILSQYPNLQGTHFKSRLSMAIKSGVKQGRFMKVRASFKINPEWTKKEKAKQKAKVAAAAAAAKKKKQQQQKIKKKKTAAEEAKEKVEREKKRKEQREKKQKEKEKAMSAEDLATLRKRQAKQKAAEEKRKEEIRRKKEIAEKIKKRKYPIEDTKLHKEDKEWGVKAPSEVKRRPPLPYLGLAVVPYDQRSQKSKKPSHAVINATKCEHLDYGSRGLASDLFQIFHFFRGDVAYGSSGSKQNPLVPEFQLIHLLHAVEEIHNGNTKKSRILPPLLQHLFVTALRLLCAPPSEEEEANMNKRELSLHKDLAKLGPGLAPTSWGEICFQYMDVMERYYTSKLSEDDNVLPGGFIDMKYLMRATEEVAMVSPVKKAKESRSGGGELNNVFLPEGYGGYLGDPRGSLSRAHAKLETKDPWFLTAEELMALLRALVDDILATKDDICRDIAERDEQMYELLKAKKAADSHFRKTRLAFEGPKQPRAKPKPKATTEKDKEGGENASNEEKSADQSDTDIAKKEDDGDSNAEKENSKPEQEVPPVWKPTVSKRQYETAIKAQQKATEAYEKGLRKLVSRREPIGQDRNFNSVYFFNHDPDMIYIEVSKGSNNHDDDLFPVDMQTKKTNWHIIDSKTLFEQYVASLDVRGTRENELYEELMGPIGGSYSLKRFMYDDMKEQSLLNGVKREEAELQRRLENARLACAKEEAEGGRRSGRLASRAQIELMQVEEEIERVARRKEELTAPKIVDYEEMTGLELLRKFDNVDQRETRRTREQKAAAEAKDHLPKMPCSTLWCTGHIDGTGIAGAIVSDILQLEELCESLSPWERKDIDRKSWVSNVEEAVHAWNSGSTQLLGPMAPREIGTPVSSAPNCSQGGASECDTPVATPDAGSKRMSSEMSISLSESKRAKLDLSPVSSASIPQLLSLLRAPLLDLEKRVFHLTGYAKATQDADDADANMSVGSNEDEQETEEGKKQLMWKKKINSLRSIPTHRYGQIREILVEAIAAARKAHDPAVVAELRAALLLHHPNAAGECKSTAIAILEKYGGYDDEDDEDSEGEEVEADEKEQAESDEDEKVPTVLSGEAMMLNGSVRGDEHANRVDWIDAVKACKTLSRFTALANAFIRNALDTLKKTQAENATLYEALGVWEKEEERKKRTRTGKASQKKKVNDRFDSSTEVWANVRYTDEFCMAKIDEYPTWPARKCEAKDPALAKSLLAANRILVNLIGEDGSIRVIEMTDILPYTGKAVEEDLGDFKKDKRTQFEECLSLARRIYRGAKKKQPSSRGAGIVEEKKSAI